MNEFVLFQSFINEDDAMPVIEILKENKIEYTVEKYEKLLEIIEKPGAPLVLYKTNPI